MVSVEYVASHFEMQKKKKKQLVIVLMCLSNHQEVNFRLSESQTYSPWAR